MRTKSLRLPPVLAAFGLIILITGCASYQDDARGRVVESVIRDSITITYDVAFKRRDIDSAALQLLPGSSGIYFAEEARIKDSLIRSLGDSLACCHTPLTWLFPWTRASSADRLERLFKDTLNCWWMNLPYKTVDSISKFAQIDSLRRRSVPCSWAEEAAGVDTVLQADSIIYRRDKQQGLGHPEAAGRLAYWLPGRKVPERYCLKIYAPAANKNRASGDISIWDGIIPPRPTTATFDFDEHGGMVGMAGGIGVSRFDRAARLGVSEDHSSSASLVIGFLYYSPTTIYQFSIQGYGGLDSTRQDPGLFSVLFGARHYLGRRNSIGPSLLGALEYSSFTGGEGSGVVEHGCVGAALGTGYETDFDRATYIYHTGQGGYHELEILIGLKAFQQAKAGFKLNVLRGGGIRFAALQAYMENRVDPGTMAFHNRRPFLVQALICSGLVTGWFVAR